MDEFWKAALKAGGPVAIVGFLIWWFIGQAFEQQLIAIFGNEQKFAFVLMITGGLLVCLYAAIAHFGKKPDTTVHKENKAVFHRTVIKGDVVLGDKTVNSKEENGE
ncbi:MULTISPECIES: hypothetical protein [Pseudomonas]|uniref:Uncharacterized protein n=1 Tax=Pseudomonas monteilii TaxID=76759 RepID=A0A399M1J9_9PSED|nr:MULTISPECIES: hypothetical protein [Pseudomonas]MDG9857993.1 hypothetical protein [Pseudomonas nitroreducens]RII75640.1 hypothetical protein D0894_21705 [Pseudomonas monteilii]